MGEPERFLNHSCNPNTKVENKQNITTRDIKAGEEITIDYQDTPIGIHPMNCFCNEENCKGVIVLEHTFKTSPSL